VCIHGRAVHFDLNPYTYLPETKRSPYADEFYLGEVRGRKAVVMGQSDVQGILSRNDTYYMSSAGSVDVEDMPGLPEDPISMVLVLHAPAAYYLISWFSYILSGPLTLPALYYNQSDGSSSQQVDWPLFPEDLYYMKNSWYPIWTPTEKFCMPASSDSWCTRGNIIGVADPAN